MLAGLRFLLNPPRHVAFAIAAIGLLVSLGRNLRAWQQDRHIADKYRELSREQPLLSRTPLVSVLAAVWNEGDDLAALLRSFSSLDYPAKQLVVAVGGAHQLSASGDESVSLIRHPGGGKLAALSNCLAAAQGEVIVITDGDCRLNSEGFVRLIAPILNGEAEATTGRHRPLPEQMDDQFVLAQWVWPSWPDNFRPEPYDELIGSNAAISRAALEETGGFDFDAPIAEDAVLGRRLVAAGFRVLRTPHSWVETRYHEEVSTYLRQVSRWRRSQLPGGRRLVVMRLADCALLASSLLAPFGGRGVRLIAGLMLMRHLVIRLRLVAFLHRAGLLRPKPALLPYMVRQAYIEAASRLMAGWQRLSGDRDRW